MAKKTESKSIELNNHEKMQIRRLARLIRQMEADREAIIKQEDKEDEKYRRKIVK